MPSASNDQKHGSSIHDTAGHPEQVPGFYRRLVEGLSDAFIVYAHDLSGQLTYISPSAEAFFGVPQTEIIGKNWRDISDGPAAGLDQAEAADARSRAGETPGVYEMCLRRNDGHMRIVEVNEHPVFDESGAVCGIEGILHDVTENRLREGDLRQASTALSNLNRKLSELVRERTEALESRNAELERLLEEREEADRELRLSEERLRSTLDAIGDAVIATDGSGVIIRLNPVAEELLGITSSEALGRSLESIVQIVDESRFRPYRDIFAQLNRHRCLDGDGAHVLVNANGDHCFVDESAAHIRNRRGEVVGLVLVLRDVSQQTELARQLRQSQKMDAIGRLAGGIAHDFNNMLTGIMSAAELLAARSDGNERSDMLTESIVQTCQRAADLTKKLLVFSRTESGEVRPQHLHQLAIDACAMAGHAFDRRIEICREFDAAEDVIVADASLIENALLNLLLNARDSMPNGGQIILRSCLVDIDAELLLETGLQLDPGRYIQLSVLDTGCGIPHELIEQIFEPFFTTKGVAHGTGLGLATVYGVMREHRGTVTVSSEVGVGSTFTLFFPLAASEVGMPVEHGDQERHETPPRGEGQILIIDDEESVRELGSLMLEELGYRCLTAADGISGLDIYRREREHIDAVILDMIMPRMHGSAVLQALMSENPQLPVIVATGYAQDLSADDLLEQGARAILRKPFSTVELAKLLRLHIAPVPS